MSKVELRHCSKCGGTAKIKTNDEMIWIECKKCGQKTKEYVREAKEFAIEDWNNQEKNFS